MPSPSARTPRSERRSGPASSRLTRSVSSPPSRFRVSSRGAIASAVRSTSPVTGISSSSSTSRSRTGGKALLSGIRVCCGVGALPSAGGERDNRRVSRPDLRRLRRPEKAEEKFLGPLETEVMARLWKRRSATVRDIVEDLARTRELAYTTVMPIMVRLHDKGLLERTREGKTYVYCPAHTRDEHRARLSRDLARGLVAEFGDAALAAFSAELDTVDATHRAALRRLAQKDSREAR